MVVFDQSGMTDEEKEENPLPDNTGKEGEGDAPKDKEDEENKDAGASGEGGESNSDGGGEDKGDGEDPKEEEGSDEEKGGGLGDLESFRAKLLDDVKDLIKPKEAPPEKPQPLTEEQKIALETEYGIPYSAIQRNERSIGMMYEKISDMINDRFASFDKGNALKSLSKEKGYEDASRYQNGVDSFLSKFDKKYHSDPEIIKMAVDAARGKEMKSEVVKAHNNGERNRKIAGVGRPASSGGKKSGSGAKGLSQMEIDTAKKHNMSTDEYRKLKGGKVFA